MILISVPLPQHPVVTFPEQKDNPSWHISGTGDFNGDGKGDILWRNLLEGRNKLWFLDGDAIIGNTGIQALDNKSMAELFNRQQ
ncbi:MAG: FG-GAP repeat protein [Acidobacteria bacterium]|nr:FG-GAP repeat protein [Acidobacteriota bacterium]